VALTGHDKDTPESLLAAADRAMYEVKRAKGSG
jgi:GGDEF domain-containing protein